MNCERRAMSFDELNEDQKLQVKQDFLVLLADKDMFVKTMRKWHPKEYVAEEEEERGPSWDELADAGRLVPDDAMRQEGVEYVPGDFGDDGSKSLAKKGIGIAVVEGIPQWAVNYFVNADASALDDEDRKLVAGYEKKIRGEGLRLICPRKGAEDPFNPYPAFGLPCDTVDFDAEEVRDDGQ